MSILLAAETLLPPLVLVTLFVVSAIALALAMMAGVFRPRPEPVLRTLYSAEPVMALLTNLGLALGVFVVASFILGRFLHDGQVTSEQPMDLPPEKLVLLNVVIPTAVFLSLAFGLATFVPKGLERLGLTRSPVRGAMFAGPMLLVAMPLVILVLSVAEYLYRAIGYQHESAHQLLTAMDPDKPLVKYGAMFAAVVVAPAFEEFLFRGHLQTLFRRMFTRRKLRGFEVAPVAQPVDQDAQPADVVAAPLVYSPPDLEPVGFDPIPSSFWPSTMAVFLTSFLFAIVHPLWSAPAIFVLSLALGFVYERTANLWVPIIMHALFNGLMTTLFLSQT